jgi:hypothetical protein
LLPVRACLAYFVSEGNMTGDWEQHAVSYDVVLRYEDEEKEDLSRMS